MLQSTYCDAKPASCKDRIGIKLNKFLLKLLLHESCILVWQLDIKIEAGAGSKQYLQNLSNLEAWSPSSKPSSTLFIRNGMKNMAILSLPYVCPIPYQAFLSQKRLRFYQWIFESYWNISPHFHHGAEINFKVLVNCMARKPQSPQKIRNLWEQYNCPCLAFIKPNRDARSHHQRTILAKPLFPQIHESLLMSNHFTDKRASSF